MTVDEAAELLERIIAPLPMNVFLHDVLDRRFMHVDSDPSQKRSLMLGEAPAQALLNAYARLSRSFGFHADGATGPAPEQRPATSPQDFLDLIHAFHDRGWTVRLDGVSALSTTLRDFVRALAVHFATPVSSSVFWSRAGALAPIHHDGHDLICIQLVGRKRWTIATKPSALPNEWAPQSPNPERLRESTTFDVKPGDLLYMPRGTTHKVEALDESLHISIGFTPPTLREALIACIDFASDRVRPLRESVGAEAGAQSLSGTFGDVPAQVRKAAAAIADYCAEPGFVGEALRARAARVVRGFDIDTAKPQDVAALSADTQVRQRRLVTCQICDAGDRVEFAFPGGRELVYPSMRASLEYIARTAAFRVGDIPDAGDDVVRVALVRKLIERGVLEVADAPA